MHAQMTALVDGEFERSKEQEDLRPARPRALRTARIARKDVNFEAPFGGLGSFSCKRSFFLEEYLLRAMFSVVNKDGAINLRDGRTLLTCPFFAGWTSSP